MAEIKVITIQAGEEFLAALTKLLGGEAAQAVKTAVESAGIKVDEMSGDEEDSESDEDCGCDCDGCEAEEEVEETFDFGQVVSDGLEESDDCFQKTYKVEEATVLNVTVTDQGVVVSGTNEAGVEFSDTIAPYGAYDEVTSSFNDWEETLNVSLFKVPSEGREVEIEGW